MKSKRFTEEQIIGQAQPGMKIVDLCRQYGISDATFYNWRSKYGCMEVSDAKRLKSLEAENSKLKQMLAETRFENQAIQGRALKKVVHPQNLWVDSRKSGAEQPLGC